MCLSSRQPSWDRSCRLVRLGACLWSSDSQRGFTVSPQGQVDPRGPRTQILHPCPPPGACPVGELMWLLPCSATSTSWTTWTGSSLQVRQGPGKLGSTCHQLVLCVHSGPPCSKLSPCAAHLCYSHLHAPPQWFQASLNGERTKRVPNVSPYWVCLQVWTLDGGG